MRFERHADEAALIAGVAAATQSCRCSAKRCVDRRRSGLVAGAISMAAGAIGVGAVMNLAEPVAS